ncbi:MAG: hypothetical protein A3E87_03780 [Gammaproteobacteria bacterium RIFCSPHIGHO2_12_FULL_35_23]|nr:MAG: hypothetical protein A3E87_03780 [Gammaproteobacteria bacterium RIFCSPHIGHO2_12_FULL_35_23]
MKLVRPIFILLFIFLLNNYAYSAAPSQNFENIITKSRAQITSNSNFQPVDPNIVKIDTPPVLPYQEIGKVYVSLYNIWGVKRQSGVISDLMQKQAAEVGGDDVYNIHVNGHYAVGDIVKEEPIN